MSAVFRTMALGLLRDRGALVMTFALPVLFFLVFAAIFAAAAGQQPRPLVALHDELGSESSERLIAALRAQPSLRPVPAGDAAQVRALVRRGEADVGLVVRREAEPLGQLGGSGAAPLLIVEDPARSAAAELLAGLVQRAYFEALPDVALGGVAGFLDDQYLELSEQQRERLGAGLSELRAEAQAGHAPATGELLEREPVVGPDKARNHVAYSAGAVAMLFLFFSTVHGALTLLEERDAGVLDRLLLGPSGLAPLVLGKAIFLVVSGGLQVTAIFAVAALLYGVDVLGHVASFAVVTLAAALAATGLALALTSACPTRRQAQTLANVVILILSALGGSMVPRFFMPPLAQQLGWLTPNTWALEAYTRIFWLDEPPSALVVPVGMLLLTGVLGLVLALRLVRRLENL